MLSTEYNDINQEEFTQVAKEIAKKATKPMFICLYGNLGSGKTFFCKKFIQSLDNNIKYIPSPSYNIALEYNTKTLPLLHVDLYRIKSSLEIINLSILEYQETHIILVEWSEKLESYKPEGTIDIFITPSNKAENLRNVKVVYN